MKTFSIIIPTYNCQDYIIDCLKSIVNQNYDLNKIQVLIIDDGSNDNTFNILQPWLKQYPMFQYYYKNNGQWGSVINFVKHHHLATNEFISVLDADDQLTPDCFEIINNDKDHFDLFVGSFWRWNGKHKTKKVHPYWFLFKRLLDNKLQMNSPYCLPLPYFVRKEVFYQTRDLIEKVAYQDLDYVSQLVMLSRNLKFTRKATGLYYYNRANNSISQAWTQKRLMAEIDAILNTIENGLQESASYRLNVKAFYKICKEQEIKFIVDRSMKFKWFPWYLRMFYNLIYKTKLQHFFIEPNKNNDNNC